MANFLSSVGKSETKACARCGQQVRAYGMRHVDRFGGVSRWLEVTEHRAPCGQFCAGGPKPRYAVASMHEGPGCERCRALALQKKPSPQ